MYVVGNAFKQLLSGGRLIRGDILWKDHLVELIMDKKLAFDDTLIHSGFKTKNNLLR